MRRSIFVLLLMFVYDGALSQSLIHVQGELLIQIEDRDEIDNVKRVFASSSLSFTEVTKIPLSIWKVSFDFTKVNEEELLKSLSIIPEVQYAQFNHILQHRAKPNDPQLDMQWQFIQLLSPQGQLDIDLNADDAWDITTGGITPLGDTIVVCVVDDGLDLDHQDFGDNIWYNHQEIPSNGIDEDGNGYVDDFVGWNTNNNSPIVGNDGSHGTPVAGIIGAQGDNGVGVTGVNWDVQLMIVNGGGSTEDAAIAAFAYPYYFRKLYNETNGDEGAFVVAINGSWGVDGGDPNAAPIWCNFYDRLGEEGILSCGATANQAINVDIVGDLPTGCSSDYLIAVTNMNREDQLNNGAAFGIESIDLGAFGEDTWTTGVGGGYTSFGGTSGATPHVTGTVALLYSAPCQDFMNFVKTDPGPAALLVKDYILNGVEPNEDLLGNTVTGGRLNMYRPLLDLMDNCSGCPLVSGVSFTNSTLEGFDVEWQEDQLQTELNLRYRHTDGEWITVEDVSSPLEIRDVIYCTEYEIEFQSICDDIENVFFGNFKTNTEGCCSFMDDNEFGLIVSGYGYEIGVPNVLVGDIYTVEYQQTGSDDWKTIDQDMYTDSYPFEAPTDCQSIDFRVKVACGDEESEYLYSLENYFGCGACVSIDYCQARFTNSSFEWLDEVEFNGDVFNSGPSINGYDNHLGVKTFEFRKDETVDFKLNPGFSVTEYFEFYQIWIDYDQDGEFNEEEEFVYQSMDSLTTQETGSFIVPENIPLGLTRMRISMSYVTRTESCGSTWFEFGETEDYCVDIKDIIAIEDSQKYDLSIYPNPATSFLDVENIPSSGQLSIINMVGQTIWSEKVKPQTTFHIALPTNMREGIYLLHYEVNGEITVQKFAKI